MAGLLFATLLIVWIAPGCTGPRAETEAADRAIMPQSRDSAGVTILTYTLEQLDRVPRIRGDTTALLTIGAADGPPGVTLDRVRDVLSRRDGSVIVADDGGTVLRLYDATGRYLMSSGRLGDGPGEFRRIDGLALLPGDSLAAYERLRGRVSVLDSELRFARSLSLPQPVALNGSFGSVTATRIHGLGGLAAVALASRPADARMPAVVPPGTTPPPLPEPVVVLDTLHLLLLRPTETPGAAAPDPLAVVPGPLVQRRGGGFSSVRFATDPFLDGNATGFLFAHGSRFEILRFDPTGRLQWIVRLPAEARPVSRSEREEIERAWQARPSTPRPDIPRPASAPPPPPPLPLAIADHHPLLESVQLDAAGNVWLQPDEALANGRGWLVIGPTGEMLGWYDSVPRSMRYLGSDHALTVTRDAMGIERIVKYAIGGVTLPQSGP